VKPVTHLLTALLDLWVGIDTPESDKNAATLPTSTKPIRANQHPHLPILLNPLPTVWQYPQPCFDHHSNAKLLPPLHLNNAPYLVLGHKQ